MFERKKSRQPQKRIDSLIGAGTTVQGDVIFSGGLRIDGAVKGRVAAVDGQPGTLVISEQARVARYRRPVTVVFAEIVGLDGLAEQWGWDVAQQALAACARRRMSVLSITAANRIPPWNV